MNPTTTDMPRGKKIKYIKWKKGFTDSDVVCILQNWVLSCTNARLISTGLHFHCRKFVREIKNIPLSEELQ